jgi:hypothetical protein
VTDSFHYPPGASTTLFCALNPTIDRGAYYSDCAVETQHVHEKAFDGDMASRLWRLSEDIVVEGAEK